MKLTNYFLVPVFLLLLLSCIKDEEQLPTIDSSTISLNLTDLDDENVQYQNVLIEAESKIIFQNISYNWNEDSILVRRSVRFILEGDELYAPKYIKLELSKVEAKANLEFDSFFQKWNYRSMQDEQNLFLKDYDQATIDLSINFKFATINVDSQAEDFRIINMKKVWVNGKEAWAIDAEFKGKAEVRHYGDETSEIFEVINGKFKGVLN
jgi:hypothetical protein